MCWNAQCMSGLGEDALQGFARVGVTLGTNVVHPGCPRTWKTQGGGRLVAVEVG